jgi:hypothetical protein
MHYSVRVEDVHPTSWAVAADDDVPPMLVSLSYGSGSDVIGMNYHLQAHLVYLRRLDISRAT